MNCECDKPEIGTGAPFGCLGVFVCLMPYQNMPLDAETQQKMERCVAEVQAQGHDEKAAIAICYTSIMSTRKKAAYDGIDFSPPQGVRESAKRGLVLRREFGRGGTQVGIARARDLSNGKAISPQTAKRMVSFFARHASDRKPKWADPTKPTNGYIAHLLWGGDDGRAWASKLVRQMESRDKMEAATKAGGMTVLPTGTTGEYTGVIAALWVDRELGNQIAIPPKQGSGLTPLAPEELHITLIPLGDASDPAIAMQKNVIIMAMAACATKLPVISVKVGGLGQFFPSEGQLESALYASVDSPELTAWQQMLLEVLTELGISPAPAEHGFNPHLTLAYTATPVDLSDIQLDPIDIRFTHLTLAWAGELIHFPLVGAYSDMAWETKAEASDSGGAARARTGGSSSRSSGGSRSGYNWGARAGQVIRGNLARGNDGKFASAGSGNSSSQSSQGKTQPAKSSAKKPARHEDGSLVGAKPKRPLKKTGSSATPRKGRATGEGSRGGKTTAQRQADAAKRKQDREAEAAKKKQERQAEAAKKKSEREAERKKRDEERAAKRAQQGQSKGGGKSDSGGKEAEREKREAEKKKKAVYKAIDKFGEGEELSSSERKLLLDEGLVTEDADGNLVLTDKGKQVMAEEAADDKKDKAYQGMLVAFKRAFERNVGGGTDRDKLKDSDFALPKERKFPVVTPKDVADAVSSWGRYRGPTSFGTFKRNLTQLAKRKGEKFVAQLPASWGIGEKEISGVAVFKQADGTYRWVGVSSNAYRDRDGEIVSTKALIEDVARTDADGRYGPLRWWHIGDPDPNNLEAPWGPGLDIGTCDFAAMNGRMLIESGTFKNAIIAEAVATHAPNLQMSAGFLHRRGEPDYDGTFHYIRRFERSLLPRGKASNPFTPVMVHKTREVDTVIKEKWDAFVSLFGGNEGQAKTFLDSAVAAQKEADAAGVKFKAATTPDDEITSGDEMVASDAEEAAEEDAEVEDKGIPYVGDLPADEFAAMVGEVVAAALAEAITPLVEQMDVEGKMAGHMKTIGDMMGEMKGMMVGYTKKEAAVAARVSELEKLIAQSQNAHEQSAIALAALTKELQATKAKTAELAGETPAVVNGYRASQAADTIVGDKHRLKGAGPQADVLDDFLRVFQQQ